MNKINFDLSKVSKMATNFDLLSIRKMTINFELPKVSKMNNFKTCISPVMEKLETSNLDSS